MRISPQRTETAKLRHAAGLQQKECAAKVGVSVSYLQKVELGKIPPSKRLASEIARLSK